MNMRARISDFYKNRSWKQATFQEECLLHISHGQSGLLNAPTGSGKTYAIWLGILHKIPQPAKGIHVLWITPLRALSGDTVAALKSAVDELGLNWSIALRTGDTDAKTRNAIKKNPPHVLVTTPESVHLMLATPGYAEYFKNLKAIVVDEWHELMGSKRGVQTELALSHLKSLNHQLITWGISATIGNLEQAMEVLLGNDKNGVLVRAAQKKLPEVYSLIPDHIDQLPWAGHLGISMLEKVNDIIRQHGTSLIFTNTRSQTEIWYQQLLDTDPDLAGRLAMHHGSLSNEVRSWVENALHQGLLKAVVCTSSLDLGVDFRPVDAIIQVGSPKGVARFIQRAGRSGHRPDAQSKIWLAPTHALELIEAAALKQALNDYAIEARVPLTLSMDVLLQYMMTLAVSDGFIPEALLKELRTTHAYKNLSDASFTWAVEFITTGGTALKAYPDYSKAVWEQERIKVKDRRTAMRHRLNMGTIVSDPSLKVKYQNGMFLGTVEEWFLAKIQPGDAFWFGGRVLELLYVRDLIATVKPSKKKQGTVPQWMGGRMPLSSCLSDFLRNEIDKIAHGTTPQMPEIAALAPLLHLQEARSHIPKKRELLIEYLERKDGCHLLVYPFEGRLVHEGMASLLALRIARMTPSSFSIGMNDYGFELLSPKPIPVEEALELDLFSTLNLRSDINESINAVELSRRKFREIAAIAGLIFQGYPGKTIGTKHLQSSSRLLYDVFTSYDESNLLLHQAREEVFDFQLEEKRLKAAFDRIATQSIVLKKIHQFSPLSFPIVVDRLREQMSNEPIEERIKRLVEAQTA